MAGDTLLESVSDLLSRAYPDPTMITSKVEISLWLSAVEDLESRLLLLGMMRKLDHKHQTRSMQMLRLKSEQSVMTYMHLRQAKLWVEQDMVQFASRPNKTSVVFPWREILSDLLLFKATLTRDPGLKKLLVMSHEAMSSSTIQESSFLSGISALPGSDEARRNWYKYYGYYVAILGLIRFEAPLLRELVFQKSWLDVDENMMLLLYSYAIRANKLEESRSRLQIESERLLENHPALKPVHHAMKAFSS